MVRLPFSMDASRAFVQVTDSRTTPRRTISIRTIRVRPNGRCYLPAFLSEIVQLIVDIIELKVPILDSVLPRHEAEHSPVASPERGAQCLFDGSTSMLVANTRAYSLFHQALVRPLPPGRGRSLALPAFGLGGSGGTTGETRRAWRLNQTSDETRDRIWIRARGSYGAGWGSPDPLARYARLYAQIPSGNRVN